MTLKATGTGRRPVLQPKGAAGTDGARDGARAGGARRARGDPRAEGGRVAKVRLEGTVKAVRLEPKRP